MDKDKFPIGLSPLKYVKRCYDNFDIIHFSKYFNLKNETDCRKKFVNLVEEMESLVNDKRHQPLKTFAKFHKTNNYSILEDETYLQYFKNLKSEAILKDYETASYNRELLASGATVKVTEDILNEFNKRPNSPKSNERTKARLIYYDDDSEEEIIVYKKKEVNIWELWEKLVHKMKNEDIHEYSLEHLHIIQLGKSISSTQTKKYYPQELIEGNDIIIEHITTSIDIHNNIIDSITQNIEATKELLANLTPTIFASEDILLQFSFDVYKAFVHELYNTDKDIYDDKECLNYRFIWPIFDSLCKTMSRMKFSPGEKRLVAVQEELSLLHNDHVHFYNADGIILNRDLNLEFAVLETVGPLNFINNSKETKDFIKAGYGLLSMLHRIGRSFCFGDFDLFKRCNIYFIQVTPIKVRIWEFSMVKKCLYCINCIGSVKIPLESESCEENLRKFINIMWLFKTRLEQSVESVKLLKQSHIENNKIRLRKLEGCENIESLVTYFKINATVTLPTKYIKDSEKIFFTQ